VDGSSPAVASPWPQAEGLPAIMTLTLALSGTDGGALAVVRLAARGPSVR
jgi:hypothetical protein